MSHQCPRCQGPVQRGHSRTAQIAGGLIGALFYAAFGPFQCAKCGNIPSSEFPPDVRSKMRMHSALMIVGALALIVGLIWLLSLQS